MFILKSTHNRIVKELKASFEAEKSLEYKPEREFILTFDDNLDKIKVLGDYYNINFSEKSFGIYRGPEAKNLIRWFNKIPAEIESNWIKY